MTRPPRAGRRPREPARNLAGAGQHVHTGRRQMTGVSGRLAGGHGLFAGAAGAGLSTLAGSDEQLGERLEQAAGTDRRGRAASAAVLDAAAADVAALAPLSDTPVGQHALLSALRARVAQQQSIVADTKARAAATAAGLRALTCHQPTTGPDDPATGASRKAGELLGVWPRASRGPRALPRPLLDGGATALPIPPR